MTFAAFLAGSGFPFVLNYAHFGVGAFLCRRTRRPAIPPAAYPAVRNVPVQVICTFSTKMPSRLRIKKGRQHRLPSLNILHTVQALFVCPFNRADDPFLIRLLPRPSGRFR